MAGEKTEAPTPRRRDEARAKGQGIGRSAEFSMGLTLGVGTLALASLLPGVAAQLVTRTQSAIMDMSPRTSNAQLVGQTGDAILTVVVLILPLACLVMIAGVGGNLVSGGLVFSYKSIRFDISRINPLSGMKRIIDKQAMVRLGLASAKLTILAFMSWQVVGSRIPTIVATQGSSASAIAGSCLSAVFQLGLTITILLAVVALVDFVVQRRKASQSIKMSKEDVKQEYKESEGDPMMRGARRRRARQMAFARMMDAVPTSDVVVTNPTTLAVALKYDSLTMKAPKIMARGQRLMAERIKQIAREHNVPVIEDKPLARALFSRPIGSEVPAHLYRAVARLLVLVHQARFTVGRNGARGGARPATGSFHGNSASPAGGFAGGAGFPGAVSRNGQMPESWWTAATAAPGAGAAPVDAADAAAGLGQAPARLAVDLASAATLYGGAAGAATAPDAVLDPVAPPAAGSKARAAADLDRELDGDSAVDDEWLESAALGLDEVDEEALAEAMADDELGDLTPDEIAQFEADLKGMDSAAADDEELPR
jgi:flagellar biosynthetic protein FlhB